VEHRQITLPPGWHTILLGRSSGAGPG
jgi:hypothetical protein